MQARLVSFVIWALVAATVVFWGLRLLVRAPTAPIHAIVPGDLAESHADLTRLLGAAPVPVAAEVAAPEASSRFRLLGIMAPKSHQEPHPGQGLALLVIDGKLPRAYAVGARVDGDLVLQSVGPRTANLGPQTGAATIRLELPLLPPAATGMLPPPVQTGAPAMPVPQITAAPTPSPATPEGVMQRGQIPGAPTQ